MFNPVISPLIHIAGFNIYPMRGHVAFFLSNPRILLYRKENIAFIKNLCISLIFL